MYSHFVGIPPRRKYPFLFEGDIDKELVKSNLGCCAEDVMWTNGSVRYVSAVFGWSVKVRT